MADSIHPSDNPTGLAQPPGPLLRPSGGRFGPFFLRFSLPLPGPINVSLSAQRLRVLARYCANIKLKPAKRFGPGSGSRESNQRHHSGAVH